MNKRPPFTKLATRGEVPEGTPSPLMRFEWKVRAFGLDGSSKPRLNSFARLFAQRDALESAI